MHTAQTIEGFYAATQAATLFSPEERKLLIGLTGQRISFDWKENLKNWAPYAARLSQLGFNHSNPEHLQALQIALSALERKEQRAKIEASKKQTKRLNPVPLRVSKT